MHSDMKRIPIKNGHARLIYAHSAELLKFPEYLSIPLWRWNFQYKLGPGPRDNVTTLTL